jgi:queuine/archaeosine tRNA-ribosyltransferase
LKYFLPYWEDWVHRDFDHLNETYSKSGFDNSIFAYEIFQELLYDGVLISIGLFGLKLKLIKENGLPKIRDFYNVKEYLRLPSNLEVFGDCGAFTYVNQKNPAIDVEKSVLLYNNLGFDYGISVDHICVDTVITDEENKEEFSYIKEEYQKNGKVKLTLSEEEKEYRRQLSIENAKKFLKLSKRKNFTPVGAVQGYSIETYIDSALQLLDYGYKYLAFGGLVPKSTEFISTLLDEIYQKIDTKKIKIHLLGVLRENLLEKMREYKIYSFDSASYYRKAWLKEDKNYLGVDKNWYASIRVPQSENPTFLKKICKRQLHKIQKMEKKVLKLLRDYDNFKLKDIDSLLEEVIQYDKLFLRNSFKEEKYFKLYKELLSSRIWRECDCPVCKTLGIDVVIFRGADRNKRRGFHNTYIFYKSLRNFKKKKAHLYTSF